MRLYRKSKDPVAEQWDHTELWFYNLVEIKTGNFGAVCMSKSVCVRAHMYTHVL